MGVGYLCFVPFGVQTQDLELLGRQPLPRALRIKEQHQVDGVRVVFGQRQDVLRWRR